MSGRRTSWWVLAGVVGLVACLLGLAVAVFAPAEPPSQVGIGDQIRYRSDVLADRAALFEGTLHVPRQRDTSVGRRVIVEVLVCGPDSGTACPVPVPRPTPAASAGAGPTPTSSPRPVRLGARVGIVLAADDSAVTVDAPPAVIQPVVDRADVARWQWPVRASEPGSYHLRGTVSVYASDTDQLLLPAETFEVTLTVRRTAGSVLTRAGRAVGSATTWIVGVLGALGGAGFITMAVGWWRSRRDRRDRRDPPAPGDAVPRPRRARRAATRRDRLR